MKKKFITTGLILMTALLTTIGNAYSATPDELYDNVWNLINKKYYDPTDNCQDWNKWRYRYEHKLKTNEDAYVAIETMLASLNDPYTKFLDPKDFEEGKINVLSCSTTFEMGVDVGELEATFQRNVPPETANYNKNAWTKGDLLAVATSGRFDAKQ